MREGYFMSKDLGIVTILGADTVGQPGQRRFRIFAQNKRAAIVLWIEKQDLNRLSLVLDRFLATITDGKVLRVEASTADTPTAPQMPNDFPTRPDYDLQVGEMQLNYDPAQHLFQLNITPLESIVQHEQEGGAKDAITLIFTPQTAQAFSHAIPPLVAAGRPTCPLCGAPLEAGEAHACIRQNGHHHVELS
jgi:uncharacterized repeat protein (TIGR03847 family)